jgi:predicted nucleic acid-binding protein
MDADEPNPADQIIAATVRHHGIKILTSAPKLLKYRQVGIPPVSHYLVT